MSNIVGILNDKVLLADILEHIDSPSLIKQFDNYNPSEARDFLKGMNPNESIPHDKSHIEAIIKLVGRPALTVKGHSYLPPISKVWNQRLTENRQAIEQIIPSVGRIEVEGHPRVNWLGTGWLVADDIIVTNRHIAIEFAKQSNSKFVFKNNFQNRKIRARIDFKEEFQESEQVEFSIDEILHIEPENTFDLAFLRVSQHSSSNLKLATPIALSSNSLKQDNHIVVIGYPARDSRNDFVEMERIFGSIYDVKRLSPGKAYNSNFEGVIEHDCSTLGGCSGSVVLDIETGKAVGLHFAGRYKESNSAVSSLKIAEILEFITSNKPKNISDKLIGDISIPCIESKLDPVQVNNLANPSIESNDSSRASEVYNVLTELVDGQALPEAERIALIQAMKSARHPIEYIHNALELKYQSTKIRSRLSLDTGNEAIEFPAESFTGQVEINFSQQGNDTLNTAFKEQTNLVKEWSKIINKGAHYQGDIKKYRDVLVNDLYSLQVNNKSNKEYHSFDKAFIEACQQQSITTEAVPLLLDADTSLIYRPENQADLNKAISEIKIAGIPRIIDLGEIQTQSKNISFYAAEQVIITGIIYKPLTINNCHDLLINAVTCYLPQIPLAHNVHYHQPAAVDGIHIMRSTNINIYNCNFIGEVFDQRRLNIIHNGVKRNSANLVRRSIALRASDSSNIDIFNCYAENIHNAFEIIVGNYITCEANIAHNLIQDMFQCHAITNSNIIENFRGNVLAYQQHQTDISSGDGKMHSDFIQIARSNAQQSTSHHLTIRGNWDLCQYTKTKLTNEHENEGFYGFLIALCDEAFHLVSINRHPNYAVGIQGVFFRSEVGGKHYNVTVKDNIILCTQHNSFTLNDIDCGTLHISNNICLRGDNHYSPETLPPPPPTHHNYFQGEGVTYALKSGCSNGFGLSIEPNQ